MDENSFKQFKNQQKNHQFQVGDIVRLKLSAYPTDRTLYTKVRTREKNKDDKKYNIINFTTTLFRIKKIYPSKIETQQELKPLQNHLSKTQVYYKLQDKYSLEEQYEKENWTTYRVQVQKKRLKDKEKQEATYYIPKFYANDLVLVPNGSTDITIKPNLNNISRLNTFDYKKDDIIVRENEKAGLEPIENRLRTRIKKEPEVIEPTRVLRSQSKLLGNGFFPVSRFAGGGIMCYYK